MRTFFIVAILVLTSLGATDLLANFLEARTEAQSETRQMHRLGPALTADPAVSSAPASVREQE
jgi:hypothetical protein